MISRSRYSTHWPAFFGILIGLVSLGHDLRAAEASKRAAALESITTELLGRYVTALADDTFEGREAGSRGGRAAGRYIVQEMRRAELAGGASPTSYYQNFGALSNLLGMLDGYDPKLKQEVIIVSAHYDHVGYGTPSNSYGPIGHIHNGADDNASGVAGLLEIIAAFKHAGRPKRSILFAFWDGEEKGLLGSQHWLSSPTVPLARVRLMINMDMIGRLRNDRLEVFGSRTGGGLRKMVAAANDRLLLDFTWEMKKNSDHFSFYERQIPILMFHTGLHGDYHRPSDDVEKINAAGMQQVARYVFRVVASLADEPALPPFRSAVQSESAWMREVAERPLPPLPSRLGLSWDAAKKDVVVALVQSGSPAERAAINVGDRITRAGGLDIQTPADFRRVVMRTKERLPMTLVRPGTEKPIDVEAVLQGQPVRLGISWRVDDAEAGAVIVTRVLPGSPADEAGIWPSDRIYRVGEREFAGSEQFLELLEAAKGTLQLTTERQGRLRPVSIALPDES